MGSKPRDRGRDRARLRWIDRAAVALVLSLPTAGVFIGAYLAWRGDVLETANLVVFVVLWIATLFGVEGGFHRYFSHRSYRARPGVEAVLAGLGSMAFQGPVLWWAATHRRHHERSDRPGDPHSPQLRGDGARGLLLGLWDGHVGWLFNEVDAISRKSTWAKYVPDLLEKPMVWSIHRNYLWWLALGFALPAVLGGALTGTWHGAWIGLVWGGLIRTFLVNHAIWAVNSICHVYGSRPFALHARDRSANNAWVALVSLGAGWHHNHHVFPGSATTQVHAWQVDGCGLILRALAKLGLVSELGTPPADLDQPGWTRRVSVNLEGAPAELVNLRSDRAFVETRVRRAVGATIRLDHFVVAEANGEAQVVAGLQIQASVDRVTPHGLVLRFASSPQQAAALTRLTRRERYDG
ncbi:Fatty acid desaturase [Enhygromyxa salina]|uniref:Fatty acid desaturase n=1 Tax=Enhygromyxa salina TaxID=215803 RepID=A0A0C2D8Q4_9BACT|nr:fatty acid desaturase [Enhygromyxa salina]KIG18005.1 Fatty acid desaturase [Enhygromyxa salina]